MLNEIEAAYIAGIIDGEGSFSIESRLNKRTGLREHYGRMRVGQTDYRLAEWLYNRLPGSKLRENNYSARMGHKRLWDVEIVGSKLCPLIELLLPLLIVKDEAAQLILKFYQEGLHGGNRRLPDTERQRRSEVRLELQAMNKRQRLPIGV